MLNIDFYLENIKNIIYCYGIYQPIYDKLKPKVTFHKGLVNEDVLASLTGRTIIVLDDLLSEFRSSTGN